MLQGKKILLGITGSIAAYKAILLLRLLIKSGADVKVLMTDAAKNFVSPLTLSTLSKNEVLTNLFNEGTWENHVLLGRWADLLVVAPLSCNTISKMANGACDNLLLATYLSSTCPVLLAPAMDEDMWKHPATCQNLEKLQSFGNRIVPVESGELASGLFGDGRMAEPETILQKVIEHFQLKESPLKGKRALITAGPTYEQIDPVRFIGNYSSGKMGVAIAKELFARGMEVTLVIGPTEISLPTNGIIVKPVRSAKEMYDMCQESFKEADITIMSAAVADYTAIEISQEKIKKNSQNLTIELTKTTDILKSLGEIKKPNQVLVGFALETNNEKKNALEKLTKKNADMIVLNSLNDTGAGFAHDTNKITIFSKGGVEINFTTKSKTDVAKDIVDTIIKLHYA